MSENETPIAPMLTTAQVCEWLSISRRTLQRYVADGSLLAIELPGGHWRFFADEVKAFLAQRVIKPDLPSEPPA